MNVSGTILGVNESKKALKILINTTRARIKTEIRKAAVSTRKKARQLSPKASGNLRKAIEVRIESQGLVGIVDATAFYSRWVEGIDSDGLFGRRPGRWPPVEPIRRWVELKGLGRKWDKSEARVTFLVRKKIGEKGTPAQPFLFPAAVFPRIRFDNEMRKILIHAAKEAQVIGGKLT